METTIVTVEIEIDGYTVYLQLTVNFSATLGWPGSFWEPPEHPEILDIVFDENEALDLLFEQVRYIVLETKEGVRWDIQQSIDDIQEYLDAGYADSDLFDYLIENENYNRYGGRL